MTMLELGTRVRIISDSIDNYEIFSLGAEGIVIDYPSTPEGGYEVRFDKGVYNSRGCCIWYVQPQDMEVVDDAS